MVDGGLRTYQKEEKIPLLKDVLQVIKESGNKSFYMDIEMKPPMPKFSERRLGTEVAKIVRKLEIEAQVVSTSFDFFKLYALEKESRAIYSGFAYDDDTFREKRYLVLLNQLMEWNFVGRFIHSNAANVEFTLLDEDSIQKYHKRGMAVGTYTPFPLLPPGEEYQGPRDFGYYKNEVLRLAKLGIDWIETDNPKIVYNIIYGKKPTI
jgi:glycerophosphoryl diester phosphodiesterase